MGDGGCFLLSGDGAAGERSEVPHPARRGRPPLRLSLRSPTFPDKGRLWGAEWGRVEEDGGGWRGRAAKKSWDFSEFVSTFFAISFIMETSYEKRG